MSDTFTLGQIATALEKHAPLDLQESYDNGGIQIGHANIPITQALLTLEITGEVINEALEHKCPLIITHHPLIFRGLKNLRENKSPENWVTQCIREGISVYAIHTQLDNVLNGVNHEIANRIGLHHRQILRIKENSLLALITYVPHSHKEKLMEALFSAGAGKIGNYQECGFQIDGQGTFLPLESAKPFVGIKGVRHSENETRLEMVFPTYLQSQIIQTLRTSHPYEEPAYSIFHMLNGERSQGSGLIGQLEKPMKPQNFLTHLKNVMELRLIKHTRFNGENIQKIAICGGAGIFLMKDALNQKADVFITGDIKHHDFFETTPQMMLCDIGHFESERFTPEVLKRILSTELPTFAARISKTVTNPVNYFI